MKKFASYFLTAIFTFYVCGFFLCFSISRAFIRAESHKPCKIYYHLKVSKKFYFNNLHRKGKEIVVNNIFYDIKERTDIGDSISLKVKLDLKETYLLNNLKTYLSSNNKKSENSQGWLGKIIKDIYLLSTFDLDSLYENSQLLTSCFFHSKVKKIKTDFFQPPEFIL
ncbi:MAG: hypothetical protein HUU47_06335 [Bacteroidetes bacterium]|nr:hypothetical protein [Bacteroidota bacterium]